MKWGDQMIRVLIADDSAFMRQVISDLFAAQPDFEVVGTARNGKEAVEGVQKYKPDLLTMDVNMPVMDGMAALEVIMKDMPTPVVMLSSVTQEGAEATIRALSLGAVDYISKTGGSISKIDPIADSILAKCRAAAKANLSVLKLRKSPQAEAKPAPAGPPEMRRVAIPQRKTFQFQSKTAPLTRKPAPVLNKIPVAPAAAPKTTSLDDTPAVKTSFSGGSGKLVAIGTSTGGPKALQNVITRLPANLPCGVVVVQHMLKGFTKSLAERLDSISEISVKEAENNDIIEAGHVYIAPGDYHMVVVREGNKRKIMLNQDPPLDSHRPAVNILFDSVAQFGKDVVSVILTGMGCDGATGMQKIKKTGGYIIAESQETAVVYGMPKAVADLGIADEIKPVQQVANSIVEAVKK